MAKEKQNVEPYWGEKLLESHPLDANAPAAGRRMIMAKKQMQHIKTCAECIHENACRAWVDGRYIADESANRCPNYETVKESSAYLCGVLDERKRKKTNADRIRSMSDEELSEFLTHMNPTNCQDCAFSHGWRCQPDRDDYSSFEKCKEGRKRWLQQPAEES